MRTATIVLPDGYATPEEFAKDCGFELARPPVASPAGREEENNRLAAGAAPNPQDTQSPPATRANARQLDGWVIEAEVRTKTGILTWGFFESRGAAEQEASRFDLRALPATLILPPEAKIDDD